MWQFDEHMNPHFDNELKSNHTFWEKDDYNTDLESLNILYQDVKAWRATL